ncbi:MAG: UvrD-helicase domain-containing protein [Desulfatiglandaceae bacterium]
MKFLADLHIHSHFSRATSKSLDPEHLAFWAGKKGIRVIGTGDFTHPGWVSELQDKLVEAENGLYKLKPDLQKTVTATLPASCSQTSRFMLTGEISCIYKKNGKTRKAHHLILMPDMASVLKFNARLGRIGNITSDGRPILGLDSKDLLEIALETCDRVFFVPAHIWTPWFSVFGSKSGFDSLGECFEDLTSHIHALETGLSSDPPMNRIVSALDDYLLVSNSDAHSPNKVGREANIFETDIDYDHMIRAMADGNGFLGTTEFYPEEGKYHLDGHRKCHVRLQPAEAVEREGICPVCARPLTIGVLHRIYELSDRDTPRLGKAFFSLIPLTEVLSELLDCGAQAKKVSAVYEKLVSELGPELRILMEVPLHDIRDVGGPLLAEGINRMRKNQVFREAGYDGEYGRIHLFEESEKHALAGQPALFARETQAPSTISAHAPRPEKIREKKHKQTTPAPFSPADPVLDSLNPEQKSAVLHQGGCLLVVAGPGTGKTMTLTHRIAFLIRSGLAKPKRVLAVTFTRKAAGEMAERISRLLEEPAADAVHVSTFHGFCLEILRQEGIKIGIPPEFALCTEIDARSLAEQVLCEAGKGKQFIRRFLKDLPGMKAQSVLDPVALQMNNEIIFSLFTTYQTRLKALGMLDFDDLEVETLRLFRDHPAVAQKYSEKYRWIFVDEYQDTHPIQVELLKKLIRTDKNRICVIGDPDQAIYGFRGADVRNFYRFVEDFPGAEVITLTKNYRSTREILQGASDIMEKEKPLECQSVDRGPISITTCGTDLEEAEMIVEHIERLIGGTTYFSLDSGRVASHEGELSIGFGDIGVLFRLNDMGDALGEALDRAGIPFVRSGETPLRARYPVNILWRFFQTLQYPDNPHYAKLYKQALSEAFITEKTSSEMFETDGTLPELIDHAARWHEFDCSSEETAEALSRLEQLAANLEGNIETFLDILSLERGIDHGILIGDRVALMSIHAAKGLEWPVVFMTGCEDRLMPCTLFGSRDEKEERRLFYVGMTRARSRLILSHAKRRTLNGRVLTMDASPFLHELTEDICMPLERRGWKPREKPHRQLKLFDSRGFQDPPPGG